MPTFAVRFFIEMCLLGTERLFGGSSCQVPEVLVFLAAVRRTQVLTSVECKLSKHAVRVLRFDEAHIFLNAKHLELNWNLQRERELFCTYLMILKRRACIFTSLLRYA